MTLLHILAYRSSSIRTYFTKPEAWQIINKTQTYFIVLGLDLSNFFEFRLKISDIFLIDHLDYLIVLHHNYAVVKSIKNQPVQAATRTQTHWLIVSMSIAHIELFVEVCIELIFNTVDDSSLHLWLFTCFIHGREKANDIIESNGLWILELFFQRNQKLRVPLVVECFVGRHINILPLYY